jgi:hypothetical protein
LAACDLAESLDVPCFTLHDLDKNGFVMAGGFPFAQIWVSVSRTSRNGGLAPEDQHHNNPERAYENLISNGATPGEAEFISEGQCVELNMFTSAQFIEYVEGKLEEYTVEKVIPEEETLQGAWQRAHLLRRVNDLISSIYEGENDDIPPMPEDSPGGSARFEDDPENS